MPINNHETNKAMKHKIDSKDFRVPPGDKVNLKKWPTKVERFFESKKEYHKLLNDHVEELSETQRMHYASDRQAVLIIFQAMDAAGKDGAIRHVMSGVNPQGCQVFSFQQPSAEELDHDFLWRTTCRLPERGRIGIFNRSYYEEVLVVRVHPEIIEARPLPHETIDERFWKNRLDDIRHLERHLTQSGTLILKFFLNLSKAEQKTRLLGRLKRPDKHWKFDPRDLDEREHWDAHQRVYQEAIEATHTDQSPWYIIPADHKWTMRAIVAAILCAEIGRLEIGHPTLGEPAQAQIAAAIARLEGEK